MIRTEEKQMRIEENLFLTTGVKGMLERLHSGSLTAQMIADECNKRIREFGDYSKVWVSLNEVVLKRQAEESQRRIDSGLPLRLLESIPVGVKDIFNTADFPTQMGSPLWEGFTPGNDARVVYYLRKEGAIIPGKTDTAEFAVHEIGNCINPHDVSRTPGTSSSGSAVAVALGMTPAAIGTQTAGSIVRPASFCGVYGCKPSFGLLPRTGMLKTTDSLDTIGYFVSRYEDLELMFNVLRVHGSNYPVSDAALKDTVRQSRTPGKPWKVAFAKTYTWNEAPDYAATALEKFMETLSSHGDFEVADAELKGEMLNSHEVHQTIYDKTLSYYFQEESLKPEQVSGIMNEIVTRGNRITPGEYREALEAQSRIIMEADQMMSYFDVIVSLSTAGEAPLREETEKPDPSLIWTLSHLPVVSCPAFISPSGLPFGMQIASRKYNDIKLFRFTGQLRELNLIPTGVYPLAPQP